MTVRLEVLPGDQWAGTVARRLAERVAAEPGLRLCLPTGDTPSPVYAALPSALAGAGASMARATVVQLDEWVGLPPGDPARCDVRLREELLERLPAAPAVAAIRVDELVPAAAAVEHDATARALDLVILGLGMNGHIGFNEPGSTADSSTRVVDLDASTLAAASERYGATRRPKAGITVGLDRILASREVWLLVTGDRKAGILACALEAAESAACPASFLRRHPALHVIADEAAAARLNDRPPTVRPSTQWPERSFAMPRTDRPSDAGQPPGSGDWQDLFDGSTVRGLRGYGQADFPADRWTVAGGRLTTVAGPGVDLVTESTFRDFEVEFTWVATPGGNSGVIYRVLETGEPSWATGPEYQVLDDDVHPDGRDAATSAGSLYAMLAPSADKHLAPAGEENRGRVLVRGGRVEHWLNDLLVVAYDWDGEDVRRRIAASKFADMDGFMQAQAGHVVFQHHGEEVSYLRIRIRPR